MKEISTGSIYSYIMEKKQDIRDTDHTVKE